MGPLWVEWEAFGQANLRRLRDDTTASFPFLAPPRHGIRTVAALFWVGGSFWRSAPQHALPTTHILIHPLSLSSPYPPTITGDSPRDCRLVVSSRLDF